MSDKITQEWYCTMSGGGCGGYILCPINADFSGVVEMVCPKCGHKHQRRVTKGVIKEDGRWDGSVAEEICPTMAAWSKKPRTEKMKAKVGNERDGVVVKTADDFVKESWVERFAHRLTGAQ